MKRSVRLSLNVFKLSISLKHQSMIRLFGRCLFFERDINLYEVIPEVKATFTNIFENSITVVRAIAIEKLKNDKINITVQILD